MALVVEGLNEVRFLVRVLVAAAAGWGIYEIVSASEPAVFVSYQHPEDATYRRLLQAWDANDRFEFLFRLSSPDAEINSSDPASVKRTLSRKINESDCVLVIVGENTADSEWVAWEIDKAKELDTPLRIVKVKRAYSAPANAYDAGAQWAYSFTEDNLRELLNTV